MPSLSLCLAYNSYLAIQSMANNSTLINVSSDIATLVVPIIPHKSG